jgi:benzoyl-CoA reductase/2-hydroxyglutaryl-CoA dehydratase subunit BcrC/BadD/HgdB
MTERLIRVIRRAVSDGRVRPAAALGALILVTRLRGRHKLGAIRRLEIENLRYYRRGLAARDDAAWTSLFAPCELLDALGLAPLCLEGLAGLLAAAGGEQPFLAAASGAPLPNTLCSFHRAIVGIGTRVLPRPRIVMATSALCDGNGISFRLLAGRVGVPFLFLDVPAEATPADVAYLVEQLHATTASIETLTGRSLDRSRLSAAVGLTREAARLARRLFLRRCALTRSVFRGPQMINVMFSLNAMAGTRALCDTLDLLVRQAEDSTTAGHDDDPRSEAAPRPARLLWTHIAPLYNYDRVWTVLDDGRRAKVVAEECSHWDDAALDCRDDFEFVARRLIGVPQNGSLERRVARLDRLRRESGADAVVHFSHWGCHQSAGAVPLVQRFFEDRGVPFLNLNGDCVDSSAASLEQHVTRAEAFLESLGRVSRHAPAGRSRPS